MLSAVFTKASLHASSQQKLLRPQELDIYYEPPATVLENPGKPSPEFLYDNIQSIRKQITGVFSGLLTTHEKVSDTYSNTEGKIQKTYSRVLEDPYFLLKPGAIALAFVGGAAVAGKGRKPIQRSLYSLLFGVTASSVCYPERFVDIATTGYYHTTSSINQLFSSGQTTTEKVLEELKEPEVKEEVDTGKTVDSIEVEDVELKEGASLPDVSGEEKSEETLVAKELLAESLQVVEDAAVPVVESEKIDQEKPIATEIIDEKSPDTSVVEKAESGSVTQGEEGFVIVNVEDSEPSAENENADNTADVVPNIVPDAVEVTQEPYDSNQDELKEVLPSPFEASENKDVKTEIEFERADDIAASVEAEGDPGQSNPEDVDMYSTRS